MQGNFLSKQTQQRIKAYLADPLRGRPVVDTAMVGRKWDTLIWLNEIIVLRIPLGMEKRG